MSVLRSLTQIAIFGTAAVAPALVYLGAQSGMLDLKNAIYGLCVVALLYHAAAWELTGRMAQAVDKLGGGRGEPAPIWSGSALRSTVLGFSIIFATVFGWIGLSMVGSLLTYGDGTALWGSLDSAVGDFIQYGSNDPRELATIGVEAAPTPALDQKAVNRTGLFAVVTVAGLLVSYFFVRAWAVVPLRHRRPKKAFTFHAWRAFGGLRALVSAIALMLVIIAAVAVLNLPLFAFLGPLLPFVASGLALVILLGITTLIARQMFSDKVVLPQRCYAKICGIKTPERLEDVILNGATHVGFVFFEKSPRNVSFATAAALAEQAKGRISRVGLVVEPTNDFLDALLAEVDLDMLQVHAHAGADRFREIREHTGIPVLAVISVADEADLAGVAEIRKAADGLLFDAKPPKNADLPGGNALTFDHRVLAKAKLGATPWMLAGGLTPDNVAEAISTTQPTYVDVSSGVEKDGERGTKDPAKIRAFLAAVAQA